MCLSLRYHNSLLEEYGTVELVFLVLGSVFRKANIDEYLHYRFVNKQLTTLHGYSIPVIYTLYFI